MEKNKVDFNNGFIYFNKLQCYLAPSHIFLCILKHFSDKHADQELAKLLKKSLFYDSKILSEDIITKPITLNKKINLFVDKITSLGFGEIIFKSSSHDQFLFIIKTTTLTNLYHRLFQEKPKVYVEEMLAYFLVNFFELLFEVNFKLEIKREKIISIKIIKTSIKKEKFENKIYDCVKKTSEEKSNQLKRVIVNKHLQINNGIDKLWGVYATFIPYYFFIELSKNNEKDDLLFFQNLGFTLGKVCVDLQKQLFGIKEELIKNVVEQTELVGNGKNYYIIKKEKIEFEYYNNLISHFKKYYSDEEINIFKNYLIYIIKGIFETVYLKKSNLYINGKDMKFDLKLNKSDFELNEEQKDIFKKINMEVLGNS